MSKLLKHEINFQNQNIKINVDEGTTIAKACETAGLPLDLVCNGKGTCRKCKVIIEEYNNNQNNENSGNNENNIKQIVLACSYKIYSDMTVYLNEEQYKKSANILDDTDDIIYNGIEFNPHLTKKFVDKKSLNLSDCGYLKGCDLYVLRKFLNYINENIFQGITFVYYDDEIIDVQLNDTTLYLYGAAVDIGTTTVVFYVYDLNSGKLLKTYSELNGQISYGADVITRINHGDNTEGLNELNRKIMLTINNMVYKAEIELPYFKENMYNICLCGNSTMQHLFFNLRPDRLGYSPFNSITKDYINCFGHEISLNCNGRCKIVFLPLIGGFVGADTAAVLLTINDDNKNKLIIDLGTNGEIAAGNINKYYVASTACGPALEGGNIACGMRGTIGAIEKFKIINDEIIYNVIGSTKPVGICGSGIIDIIAELLMENIIDKTGRILSNEEYINLKPKSKLYNNLKKVNGINSFIINDSDDETIYITQKDIRQIQLAKSSIYTGCEVLMDLFKTENAENCQINEIVLAGAFGNYIDVKNAIFIGLLPSGFSNVISIGNGAGKGISMFLLNKDIKNKCDTIVKNSVHFELADNINFTESYIENMNFNI